MIDPFIVNYCKSSISFFRPGGISVHYSLIFEISSPKIGSEDAEAATGTPSSSADSKLREMVAQALREEATLPIDLQTLNFEPGTRKTWLNEY